MSREMRDLSVQIDELESAKPQSRWAVFSKYGFKTARDGIVWDGLKKILQTLQDML